MARSRNFSVYLLKPNSTPDDAIEDPALFNELTSADATFENSRIFVKVVQPANTWWVASYFSLPPQQTQQANSAIVFVPVHDRWFALTFGFAASGLNSEVVEHDFGRRAAMTMLDDESIISADSFTPGDGRRQRTQLPKRGDVFALGIDSQAALVKSLTGRVKADVNDSFRQITGSTNARVTLACSPAELIEKLEILLEQFTEGQVGEKFRPFSNFQTVTDPTKLSNLDEDLLNRLHNSEIDSLSISIPEIVDYGVKDCVKFSGLGRSEVYDEISIINLLDYIGKRLKQEETLSIERLKRLRLVVCNEQGEGESSPISVYSSIFYECGTFPEAIYNLFDGKWHRLERDFVNSVNNRIHPHFCNHDFIDWPPDCRREADYNEILAASITNSIVLDQAFIQLGGTSKFEPCDVLSVSDDRIRFIHVKRHTSSHSLSHLFAQGQVSIDALLSDQELKNRFLENCVRLGLQFDQSLLSNANISVIYVITTHKPVDAAELNLPIFSRINADRALSNFRTRGIRAEITFVREPRNDPEDNEVIEP